jgi:hypothetical protein
LGRKKDGDGEGGKEGAWKKRRDLDEVLLWTLFWLGLIVGAIVLRATGGGSLIEVVLWVVDFDRPVIVFWYHRYGCHFGRVFRQSRDLV